MISDLYFYLLPKELILLIIRYIDISRFALPNEIIQIGDILKNSEFLYYDYMNMIYDGYINNFHEYTLDEINNTLDKYYIDISGMLKKLDKNIRNGIFYHVYAYNNTKYYNSRYVTTQKLYYICKSESNYLYIQVSSSFRRRPDTSILSRGLKIKEYKTWKNIWDNLLCDQMIKILDLYKYELPKYKKHKGNKF